MTPGFVLHRLRRASLALCAAVGLLLSACGGGGSGDSAVSAAPATSTPGASGSLAPSASLAGICTLSGQQQYVRSLLDEIYLWYDRIVDVDPARYRTVADYFNALLVRTPDANGLPTDRFSVTLTSAEADAWLGPNTAAASAATPALLGATASSDPVPIATVLTSPGGTRVAYLVLDHQLAGAQDAFLSAVNTLQAQSPQQWVIDLRRNHGGYLYVAQTVASTLAGAGAAGQVFESLRFNARQSQRNQSWPFSDRVLYAESASHPAGQALPALGLGRAYVLSTGETCSASESILNSLRGIGFDVVQVGSATCGKPYGFERHDNCSQAYLAIEFEGVNARGEGGYTRGLAPTCAVAPRTGATLGDPSEPLLQAALYHVDHGRCPPGAASALSASAPDMPSGTSVVPPPTAQGWRMLR